MLTRGEGEECAGRPTQVARHLVDLAGSVCRSAEICYERWTAVPAILECFTRLTPGFDGDIATWCDRVPVKTAVP